MCLGDIDNIKDIYEEVEIRVFLVGEILSKSPAILRLHQEWISSLFPFSLVMDELTRELSNVYCL